jgi:hypothetical protein
VNKTSLAGLALIAGLAQTLAAHATTCPATTLCRADTITNVGSISTPTLDIVTTPNATNGPFGGSISYSLGGNAFGGAGQSAFGSDFSTGETIQGATGSVAPDSGWNFYDDYFFSTTTATANNATVISNISTDSISNIQVRILTSGGESGTPNPTPTLGIPTTGTVVDAWTAPIAGTGGSLSILLPTAFAAGSYDLQVRGEVTGVGASYGGTLQVAPVPLPAGLPLLLSGLGMLGGLVRRRAA